MTTYSPFFPGTGFDGVQGTTLPATRNAPVGDWDALPLGTVLNLGDIVTYQGSSFIVSASHTKTSGTAAPPSNGNYTLLAEAGADGQPLYTWFAYADSSDGTVNFTTGVGGTRQYLGIAANKTSPVESSIPSDYTWSKIQGAPAKLLYVSSDRQLIGYDGTGALSPATQTTLFTIYPQNLSTGTYTVSMTRQDGVAVNANTYLTAVSGAFAASGNNITWTGSGTQFQMTAANFNTAKGATDGVIVTVTHVDGVTDTISIVANYDGTAGTPGINAKLLYMYSDRQLISYDGTGTLSPATQTTTFTIAPQNLTSGTYTLSMTRADGVAVNANTYLTAITGAFAASGNNITWTGSGTTFQMTAANFNTAASITNGVIVTVTHSDGVSDKLTVLKQSAGATGATGPTLSLSANELSFDFVDGYPTNGSQVITVTAVSQNISETINWSVTPSVTLGAPNGTQRTLSIANFGANAAVTITATGATSGATASITLIRTDISTADDNLLSDGDFFYTPTFGAGSSALEPWTKTGPMNRQTSI